MRKKVIELRLEGKTYREISNILNISKATVSYHLQNTELNGSLTGNNRIIFENEIKELNEYYKTHTLKECSEKFGISLSTAKKYVDNKRTIMTDDERKKKNYGHLKSYRKKLKEKLVELLGGKCVICGYDRCSRALEFHHLDPNEKEFTIGFNKNMKFERALNEVKKCKLVCSNCHKEIHDGLISLN